MRRYLLKLYTIAHVAFEGKVADAHVRRRYVGKSVAGLFKYGNANPVTSFWKYRDGCN